MVAEFRKTAGARDSIRGWKMLRPPPSLRCETANRDNERRSYQSVQQYCMLYGNAYIEQGISSGNYDVAFRTLKSDRLNGNQFYTLAGSIYNEGQRQHSQSYRMSGTEKRYFTKFQCSDSILRNKSGVAMKINTCLRGYVRQPKVLDAEVKLFAFSPGDPPGRGGVREGTTKNVLLSKLAMRGFALESILELVHLMSDSIERIPE
jgi:hypothetical protein